MVKGHPLSLAVHLEHATNLAGTKGSNGYLFSTHEGWNDTRTVKSTSTNSSCRFTVANDALEQGFALVTCIGPGLSIDLLLLYPPDVEQRRLVFYFSSIGGEGWFIGNRDASSTCLDRKYRELDSQSRHSRTRPRRRIISLEISLMNNSRPSCRYLRICSLPQTIAFVNTRPPARTWHPRFIPEPVRFESFFLPLDATCVQRPKKISFSTRFLRGRENFRRSRISSFNFFFFPLSLSLSACKDRRLLSVTFLSNCNVRN